MQGRIWPSIEHPFNCLGDLGSSKHTRYCLLGGGCNDAIWRPMRAVGVCCSYLHSCVCVWHERTQQIQSAGSELHINIIAYQATSLLPSFVCSLHHDQPLIQDADKTSEIKYARVRQSEKDRVIKSE